MLLGVAEVDRQAVVAVHQSDQTINQISDVLERPRLLAVSVYLLYQSHILLVQNKITMTCNLSLYGFYLHQTTKIHMSRNNTHASTETRN